MCKGLDLREHLSAAVRKTGEASLKGFKITTLEACKKQV